MKASLQKSRNSLLMLACQDKALIRLVIMQFDIHSPANTVLEALNFSAELRLEGVDAKQRKAFVDEVCFLLF